MRRRFVPMLVGALAAVAAVPAWAGTTERVSVGPGGLQADGSSSVAGLALSAGGRFVAFGSWAANLVVGDTNGAWDAFVHDRQTRTTELITVGMDGAPADGSTVGWMVSLSADGRFVAFGSDAPNLVPGDSNRVTDVFLRDRTAKTTRRVSVASNGAEGSGYAYIAVVSPTGRYVGFGSHSSNLVPSDTNGVGDAFVHDTETGATERMSISSKGVQGNAASDTVAISSNGRYVLFHSAASNLVNSDTNGKHDVFLRDRRAKTTTRVSVSSSGAQANGDSYAGWITGDGQYAVFTSDASNLVKGDSNRKKDVFVRNLRTGKTERVSLGTGGRQGNGDSEVFWPTRALTQDGR
jgi:TolB protein